MLIAKHIKKYLCIQSLDLFYLKSVKSSVYRRVIRIKVVGQYSQAGKLSAVSVLIHKRWHIIKLSMIIYLRLFSSNLPPRDMDLLRIFHCLSTVILIIAVTDLNTTTFAGKCAHIHVFSRNFFLCFCLLWTMPPENHWTPLNISTHRILPYCI